MKRAEDSLELVTEFTKLEIIEYLHSDSEAVKSKIFRSAGEPCIFYPGKAFNKYYDFYCLKQLVEKHKS
jgi:hypothetical protein